MDVNEPVLVLRRSEVMRTLEWPALMAATRRALTELSSSDAMPTSSTQLAVPGAALHLKAGALPVPPVISVKANLRPDLGNASGAILVFEHARQRLEAIIASSDITAMRTAAIAAVAATALGTRAAPSVAIIGAGPVARRMDEVLTHLRLPADVRVWSRSPERARRLVEANADDIGRRACSTVADAVAGADLVITCTPARAPLVHLHDLPPEAVVLAMGADSPGKRELAPSVVETATLFADVPRDALRVGECACLGADGAGRVNALGTVLAAGSTSAPRSGLLVFDSVGSSAVDAAVVGLVIAQAKAAGLGTALNLEA